MDTVKGTYGICRICGCTDSDPCYHPRWGACWWADETHTICSHCADKKIARSKATIHCISSRNIKPVDKI